MPNILERPSDSTVVATQDLQDAAAIKETTERIATIRTAQLQTRGEQQKQDSTASAESEAKAKAALRAASNEADRRVECEQSKSDLNHKRKTGNLIRGLAIALLAILYLTK